MWFSEMVDLGLEVATAPDATSVTPVAFMGLVALGAAPVGAVLRDREERAVKVLEDAGCKVVGLRVLDNGELQVVIDATDLGRDAEADAQAKDREKRAYQVLMCAGLAPTELDAAFVTRVRRKASPPASKSLFQRIPPLVSSFLR